MRVQGLAAGIILGLTPLAASAQPTASISIVGSSVVQPFTAAVAESFAKVSKFPAPKLERADTSESFKQLCTGGGADKPDIVQAVRKISAMELAGCAHNKVAMLVEFKIGYDAVVLARSKKGRTLNLTSRSLFLALAKEIPDPANPTKLIANPNTTWNQVDPKLPDAKIAVIGPSRGSAVYEAFDERVLEEGCGEFRARFNKICGSLREDGVYTETGEDSEALAGKIGGDPNIVGIVSYGYLQAHRDQIIGGPLNGFGPTLETISSSRYPASRAFYLYVNKASTATAAGLKEFMTEYVSDRAIGPQGYLVKRGLIAPDETERRQLQAEAQILK